MRSYSATLALKPVISELGDKDIEAAVTAIRDVTVTDVGEEADVETACDTLEAAFGAYTGLKVFIDTSGSPTKAQVLAALASVAQQINSCNLFS